jgi:Holliday junction resolvasome RuvABC endonuclease subunit
MDPPRLCHPIPIQLPMTSKHILGVDQWYPLFTGTVYWGIDMSLRSPGFCLRDDHGTVYLTGFHARKRDLPQVYSWPDTTWYVALRPILPEDRWAAIRCIVEAMEEMIRVLKQQGHTLPQIHIEGYAFAAQSSSITSLAELGGVIRYTLRQHGLSYTEWAPQSVKLQFTDYGHATKEDMFARWSHHVPAGKVPVDLDLTGTAPLYDFVDAYALSHMSPLYQPLKKKRKKHAGQ